jgi:flagellar hook-length control protein FliK
MKASDATNARALTNEIQGMIRNGQDRMTIRLVPQHLGELEITVQAKGAESIDVKIVPTKAEAVGVLRDAISELKQNLERNVVRQARIELDSSFAMNANQRSNTQVGVLPNADWSTESLMQSNAMLNNDHHKSLNISGEINAKDLSNQNDSSAWSNGRSRDFKNGEHWQNSNQQRNRGYRYYDDANSMFA